ncbi:DUF7659 family protein [Mammaliicoccus lentus]|uniref:DUF7659 family protein n=1 Tax=Mammaliicoccus lentus TaxID=42858 RepID=UPI001071C31D|nr:hypothetical protein [Mammaliicoccus lentus]MBF0795189.1 hypothetical protein [Mammaliicoccus lentus]TFV14591.1 hypothetical protein E4T78_11035 [Mammaliicoccus lentus]
METYLEFKERTKKETEQFPMFFAFDNEQLKEGKKEINASDDDKLLAIGGGGYIKVEDKQNLLDLFDSHEQEHKSNMLANDDYVYHMVKYELGNHEFVITYDTTDTFRACGLTKELLNNNPQLQEVVNKAVKDYEEEVGM